MLWAVQCRHVVVPCGKRVYYFRNHALGIFLSRPFQLYYPDISSTPNRCRSEVTNFIIVATIILLLRYMLLLDLRRIGWAFHSLVDVHRILLAHIMCFPRWRFEEKPHMRDLNRWPLVFHSINNNTEYHRALKVVLKCLAENVCLLSHLERYDTTWYT